MYDKPIANIILNAEKLKLFSLNQEWVKSACSLLFSIVLEFLTRAIRQEEKKKEYKYLKK
jgi:hypothetical protein